MMVLDCVISEMEKELRETGKALWRVTLEGRRIEAKEWRETDAAGGGVTWKAARAELGPVWRVRGVRQLEGLAGEPKHHD